MSGDACLYLLCGKIAAGKSTLAQELSRQHDIPILAEDQWLAGLFGDRMSSLQDFIAYSTRLRQVFTPHITDLLRTGSSLILDFQANTIESRAWIREMIDASGCRHELHWLDIPDEICKSRMLARNQSGNHPFAPTEEQFDRIAQYFQPPEASEEWNIVHHRWEPKS